MALAGYKNYVRTDGGSIVPSADIEVRFRENDGSAGDLASIFSDNQGTTAITQPGFAAGSDGSFEFFVASGQYIIVVGSGASQESVPVDIVNANKVLQFNDRASFVQWVADGYVAPDGSLASDGTVQYAASAGVTDISDLGGWLPFGDVTPLHWAENTTQAVTDMTAALNAAMTYLSNPDESNLPGNINYRRYHFNGRTLDLLGQVYLVSDAIDYGACHGILLKNGCLIADSTSANWAANKLADADAALLTNKGNPTGNLKFERITIECNEVINGIYMDRPFHGETTSVQVFGCWNQSFGIKVDRSDNPGVSFSSNVLLKGTEIFGLIGGNAANLSAFPTCTGIVMYNGDVQIVGGEIIRVFRGIECSADALVTGMHISPFVVDLTATASVTNGSPTVTVTDATNIEADDLLEFGTDPNTRYSVQSVSGTTITLASNFAGTTDAATNIELSKHDAEGIRCAPVTGSDSGVQQIVDNYFDQTILAIQPRYVQIADNLFRKVPQPGPYGIKFLSFEADEPIVGINMTGNLMDLRRGEQAIFLDGSFDTEPRRCVFDANVIQDDQTELPLGVSNMIEWTPVMSDGTNDATSSAAYGVYYRNGNMITAQMTLTLSSVGSVSGAVRITGLPFTAQNPPGGMDGNYACASVGFASNLTLSSGEVVTGYIPPGADYILLQRWGTSGTAALQSTNLTATTGIRLSISYLVD